MLVGLLVSRIAADFLEKLIPGLGIEDLVEKHFDLFFQIGVSVDVLHVSAFNIPESVRA